MKKTKIPKSMFGAYKNLKPWNKKEDRIKMDNEKVSDNFGALKGIGQYTHKDRMNDRKII